MGRNMRGCILDFMPKYRRPRDLSSDQSSRQEVSSTMGVFMLYAVCPVLT
jgi:hypothetical protein